MINLSSNFMHTALCFKNGGIFYVELDTEEQGAVIAHCAVTYVIHHMACIHTSHLALQSK